MELTAACFDADVHQWGSFLFFEDPSNPHVMLSTKVLHLHLLDLAPSTHLDLNLYFHGAASHFLWALFIAVHVVLVHDSPPHGPPGVDTSAGSLGATSQDSAQLASVVAQLTTMTQHMTDTMQQLAASQVTMTHQLQAQQASAPAAPPSARSQPVPLTHHDVLGPSSHHFPPSVPNSPAFLDSMNIADHHHSARMHCAWASASHPLDTPIPADVHTSLNGHPTHFSAGFGDTGDLHHGSSHGLFSSGVLMVVMVVPMMAPPLMRPLRVLVLILPSMILLSAMMASTMLLCLWKYLLITTNKLPSLAVVLPGMNILFSQQTTMMMSLSILILAILSPGMHIMPTMVSSGTFR